MPELYGFDLAQGREVYRELTGAFGRRGERPRRVAGNPRESVVASLAAGHGFTATGTWASTNLNDTGDSGYAGQVISGVTPGNGSGVNFVKTGLTPFDPTGKHIALLLKCSDPAKLSALTLYVGVDTGMTNSHMYYFSARMQQAQPDEWMVVTGHAGWGAANGTGAGTAATALRLRIADTAGQPGVTVKLGGVALLTPAAAYPNGVVSFTFDDAYAGHYTHGKPALGRYRYRGTLYPILDQIGKPGKITLDQIRELDTVHGWEIGAHASTIAVHDAGLDMLSADARDAEMQALRAFQLGHGLRGDTIAYPQGRIANGVATSARPYFTAGRTTEASPREVLPAPDPMRLRSYSIGSADTLATLTGLVDAAYAERLHQVFTVHDVVASGATGAYQMNAATLISLVDYCATKGIPVLPLGEVVASY